MGVVLTELMIQPPLNPPGNDPIASQRVTPEHARWVAASPKTVRQQLQPDFRLAHLQRLINPNPVRPSAKPMAKVPAGDRRKPHHTPVEGKRRRVLVRWHPHCNIDAAVDIGIHRHFFIYPPSLKRGRQSCHKGRILWLFNNCIERIS